jgi:hypothetical protein
MARNITGVLALGLAIAFTAAPAMSHHSLSAEFDVNQPIEFTARVVQVDWLNPHIYTHVEVTEGPMAGQTFKIEGGPPNSLYRQGWREDTLQPGQIIHVEGIRAKNPNSPNIGDAAMTLENGDPVFARFGRAGN